MLSRSEHTLSRRERQIMDILYRQGRASAADVLDALPDPPSYSTVRALLRVLETKGHARHVRDGAKHIFLPTKPRQNAARSAVRQLLQTFFGGSVTQAVATLLSVSEAQLSPEEFAHLEGLIAQAREDGKTDDGEHDHV